MVTSHTQKEQPWPGTKGRIREMFQSLAQAYAPSRAATRPGTAMNIFSLSHFMKLGGSKYALMPLLAGALLSGCGGGTTSQAASGPAPSGNIALSTVASGLTAPLDLQQPNDGSGRL